MTCYKHWNYKFFSDALFNLCTEFFCFQIFWMSVFIPFHCQDRFIIVISYVTWFTFNSTGFTSFLGIFMKYFSESLVITLQCILLYWIMMNTLPFPFPRGLCCIHTRLVLQNIPFFMASAFLRFEIH